MQTAIEADKLAPNAGGDAELIRLAAELDDAFKREWEAHERARMAEERGEPFAQHEAEAERLVDESEIIAETMAGLSATSQAGLLAKARAVAWCLGGDDELTFAIREPGTAPDERLARSIVQDLLRMHAELPPDDRLQLPTNSAQRVEE